jgi:hypothetical protein
VLCNRDIALMKHPLQRLDVVGERRARHDAN